MERNVRYRPEPVVLKIESGPEYQPDVEAEWESEDPCSELMHILDTDPDAADLNARLHDTFETRPDICVWLLIRRERAENVRKGQFDAVEADLEALDSGVYL